MREVRAQGRHAGTAADIHHFLLRRLDVEIAERADGGDGVARFEAEHVGGADARRAILSRRRRGDADVEAEHAIRSAGLQASE